jgi:hypothetical protein
MALGLMYNKTMNDDTVNDLKMFITTTISQQTTDIRGEISSIRGDIKKLDVKLSNKIDDLSSSVADALDSSNDATDVQLKDHEQRIGLLEQKVA